MKHMETGRNSSWWIGDLFTCRQSAALIWLCIFPRKSLNGAQQTSKENCNIQVNIIFFFNFVKSKGIKTTFCIPSPPLLHQNFSHLCSSFWVEGDQFFSILYVKAKGGQYKMLLRRSEACGVYLFFLPASFSPFSCLLGFGLIFQPEQVPRVKCKKASARLCSIQLGFLCQAGNFIALWLMKMLWWRGFLWESHRSLEFIPNSERTSDTLCLEGLLEDHFPSAYCEVSV